MKTLENSENPYCAAILCSNANPCSAGLCPR